jgi:carboxypeptidase C (cathepsin A)
MLIAPLKLQMCIGELCYAENEVIKAYLDLPSTRSLLGVETTGNFSSCSAFVSQNFVTHMDKWAVPSQYYVAGLLDRGVRVLIYAGTYDWQCNWVANKLWLDKLEWSGKEGYEKARWRDWDIKRGMGKAGEVKSWGTLTFATIRDAGHMMGVYLFYVKI